MPETHVVHVPHEGVWQALHFPFPARVVKADVSSHKGKDLPAVKSRALGADDEGTDLVAMFGDDGKQITFASPDLSPGLEFTASEPCVLTLEIDGTPAPVAPKKNGKKNGDAPAAA